MVQVDGFNLSKVRLDTYRTQLGVVLQETFLFDGTIRENIAFSRPDATDEEVMNACHIARVDEFAEKFTDGYATVVGERGVKLSGGQRQRVSIARAILADPRILILDEATSSLDSESEALIQEGLSFLMRGRTTFVIAHRLSTIRRADQILVVEGGLIIERGNHDELFAARGRYFDLYTRQHGLEMNLFLAPGEGDTIPETHTNLYNCAAASQARINLSKCSVPTPTAAAVGKSLLSRARKLSGSTPFSATWYHWVKAPLPATSRQQSLYNKAVTEAVTSRSNTKYPAPRPEASPLSLPGFTIALASAACADPLGSHRNRLRGRLCTVMQHQNAPCQ